MRKIAGIGLFLFLAIILGISGNLFAAEKPVTIMFESVYPPSHARLTPLRRIQTG
jgi:hypothetical protein